MFGPSNQIKVEKQRAEEEEIKEQSLLSEAAISNSIQESCEVHHERTQR